VIRRVGPRTVNDPDDVIAAVQDLRAGARVELEVQRDGQRRTLRVTLGTRPDRTP